MPDGRHRTLIGMAMPPPTSRRPLLTDAAAALCITAVSVTALLNHVDPGHPARAIDWLITAVVPLVLLGQRRASVLVAWALIAGAWLGAAVPVQTPVIALVAVVALYPLARERPLRYVWPPAAVIGVSIAAAWIHGGHPWTQLWAFAAVLAALVLLGVNARTRRAYLTGLEERSRRLEIERDQRARLAVVDEQARIAREMHDIVAHHLTVIVTLSDGAAMTAETAPRRASQTMDQVSATGRAALGDMRRLVSVLRGDQNDPATDPRGPQPGIDDIDNLAAQIRAAGVPVRIVRHGTPGRWGPAANLAVYRILQEALTNVLKHAGTNARAVVELTYTPSNVDIVVTNTGTGPAGTDRSGAGAGMVGMRERAEAYDGFLHAGPGRDGGWKVHATLQFDEVIAA
jgi:signal transduction histidine kinase